MLGIILLVILILLLVGGLPNWGHMAPYNYGYYPSFGVLLLIIVLLVLIFGGHL
jgi:hypothetical protein